MPLGLAVLSATEGAVFGLFPIMWIVFTAIWLYQVTVISGRFEDLRAAFHLISDDPRVQAIIIAFCFGGLLEALAGFGAPVAITGVMLMALGFSAVRAAVVVLLANTAPVAFGAIGTPIITAGTLTGIPYAEIGAYVGRQTPILAFIVPLLLVLLVDGMRGVRQTWPVALSVGIDVRRRPVRRLELPLGRAHRHRRRARRPGRGRRRRCGCGRRNGGEEAAARLHAEHEAEVAGPDSPRDGGSDPAPSGGATKTRSSRSRPWPSTPPTSTRSRMLMAFFPYLLVIAVFSLAKLAKPVSSFLTGADVKIAWPGLDGNVLSAAGKPVSSTVYNFQWLSSPGSLLLICGFIVALVYRVPIGRALRELAPPRSSCAGRSSRWPPCWRWPTS